MAQIDTDLGWSAEADWLLQSGPIDVASVGVYEWPAYPAVPLPVSGSTPYEVYQRGSLVAEAGINQLYASADVAGAMFLRLEQQDGGMIRPEAYSPLRGAHCYLVVFNTVMQTLGNVSVITIGDSPYGTYSGVPWYSGIQNSISLGTATFYVSTLWPGYATPNITFNGTTFTKSNPGYAVACLARWKTQTGTVISSPILISTESTFVDMTTGASYNLAKLNALRNGLKFYMGFWDVTDAVVQSQLPIVDMAGASDPYLTLEQLFKVIASSEYADIRTSISPDPWEENTEPSTEEGGFGDELEDDVTDIDTDTPKPSAIDAGICKIYTPSQAQLENFADYLWGTSFDVDQVKKLFSSPMESVLGLSAVPVSVVGGTPVPISLGGVQLSGVSMPPVRSQYREIDMGSIFVKERWGSYLDYEPYTKFSILLPYIGIQDLSADDIMGKTLHLVYNLEVVSGAIVARLSANGHCIYQWAGNCAMQLPITGRSFDTLVSSAVSIATKIGAGIVTGGGSLIAQGVASAAVHATTMKPTIERSGTVSGVSGYLGQPTPYLIRTTPEAYIPNDQNAFIGYPSYISLSLGEISGYNEVESIHLENIPATGDELTELEQILKEGVIF